MTTEKMILMILILIFSVATLTRATVDSYKIGYYEEKLKSLNVDIEAVEEITFIEIINK